MCAFPAGFKKPVTLHPTNDLRYTDMPRFFHPLIMVLARATESELARYVEYLRAENPILRDELPIHVA